MVGQTRTQRVEHALAALRRLLRDNGLENLVLTTPGNVAWATGGMNPPIDRTAAIDLLWVCVSATRFIIVTTEIEAPRVLTEMEPELLGISVVGVPWWDAEGAIDACVAALEPTGSGQRRAISSDGHQSFGSDITDILTSARMNLASADLDELRNLGREATQAVQDALTSWVPGEADFQIQSRIAGAVERTGADCPVLLVGADDRVARFRHPVANGSPTNRLVMAVLVARRSGLHVALTRYASVGTPARSLSEGMASAKAIQTAVLAAHTPGVTYGSVMATLEDAYVTQGSPGVWREHYQGGPIGYAQREFEIAPVQSDSRWWNEPVRPGNAVAWNPSVAGGGKDEDTYIVNGVGPHEWVTSAPGWPTSNVPGTQYSRPDVLLL